MRKQIHQPARRAVLGDPRDVVGDLAQRAARLDEGRLVELGDGLPVRHQAISGFGLRTFPR